MIDNAINQSTKNYPIQADEPIKEIYDYASEESLALFEKCCKQIMSYNEGLKKGESDFQLAQYQENVTSV